MELTTAYLLIEVTDTRAERMPQLPGDLSRPDPGEEHGRGLFLVDALASRWASPSGRPASVRRCGQNYPCGSLRAEPDGYESGIRRRWEAYASEGRTDGCRSGTMAATSRPP